MSRRHATPSHDILPARIVTRAKDSAVFIEFTCRCIRQHRTLIKLGDRWVNRPQVHLLPDGHCGRIDRRVRPLRGPTPSRCDECLAAYDKDYHDIKRAWVDPPRAAIEAAVAPTEISTDPYNGTYRYGNTIVKSKTDSQRDGAPREWSNEEIAATAFRRRSHRGN